MNLLEEIQNAPVEWKELGEVFNLKNGYTPSKKNKEYWIDGTIPWFRLEDIRTNGRFLNKAIQTISETAVKGNIFPANSLIVSTTATIGEVALISVPFLCNQQITALYKKEEFEEKIDIKFAFYYLQLLSNEMKKGISIGSFPIVSVSKLKKYKIPIPPLSIQEKIVQTLDKFTDYVTELTSELTLRQKQYSYFRDYLLNFDQDSSGRTNNKVEWKTLGEVCLSTKTISWKSEDEQKQFKYIDLSSVSRENKKITDVTIITKSTAPSRAQKIIKKDDILFATTRPMLKRFTKVTKEYNYQICSTGFCVLRPSDKILSNYLYHLVASSNFYDYVERNQSGASYPAISDNLVKNYQFPLPPLSIQEKIVHVLDNFDTVCNDLNIGLPKEIELRQKQYEYFRDQLLTYTAEGVYTDSTVQTRPN
ncbi:restriction endonuclease subunit S [Streptococcus sobrinus]|uniref:restriction endonuclease subunit S n=1 Tax=Streptococcus sobrinus TaxID=1310 RepID=UPI00031E5DE6|nr:restriction endonuclease subunit S [Streptococcus sobrinus]